MANRAAYFKNFKQTRQLIFGVCKHSFLACVDDHHHDRLLGQTDRLPRRHILQSRCQFHQYITSSFCANIFAPKNYKSQIVTREKLRKTLLYKR